MGFCLILQMDIDLHHEVLGDKMYSSNVIRTVMCCIMTPCCVVRVYHYFRGADFFHQCSSGPCRDSGCLCIGEEKKHLTEDRYDQS
jgi:hypothetical protein